MISKFVNIKSTLLRQIVMVLGPSGGLEEATKTSPLGETAYYGQSEFRNPKQRIATYIDGIDGMFAT